MQTVIDILTAFCLAFVSVEIVRVQDWKPKWLFNHKPFVCTVCMSGWWMLAICMHNEVDLFQTVQMMAFAMTFTAIFGQIIKRI